MDLISRQAAIDLVKSRSYDLSEREDEWAMVQDVEELPSAQPERWIPCSERLPEGIGQVIIQTNGDAIHEVFYKGKNDYGHEVWMRLDGGIYWDDEVIAWMPLPEPYAERRTDEAD